MSSLIIDEVLQNNYRSISRIITRIENNDLSESLRKKIYSYTSNSIRIGITGPPGAGKSTLTNQLIDQCLINNKSVGVIAVDPTSPFTGGALLGDRVRMNDYIWDDRVFIRSMGNNGELGGLSKKAQEVGDVLAASGKDLIIYETVGVGQAEHDIIKVADLCIVVLVPESGDEVQLMKAGLIEIADLFVINKSDREGANKLTSYLKNILHIFKRKEMIEPSIYNTCAIQGEGIVELYLGLQDYIKKIENNNILVNRRLERYKKRVFDIIDDTLRKSFWTDNKTKILKDLIKKKDILSIPPNNIVKELISGKRK